MASKKSVLNSFINIHLINKNYTAYNLIYLNMHPWNQNMSHQGDKHINIL